MLNLDHEPKISLNNLAIIFGYSFFLGILFDKFFYQQALGASFPIYVSLIFLGYLILSPLNQTKYNSGTMIMAAVGIALSSMAYFRADLSITLINVVISILIMLLAVMSSVGLKLNKYRLKEYFLSLFIPLEFITTYMRFLSDFSSHMTYFKNNKLVSQIFRGILITVPVVSILALLLSSADMVFDKYLRDIVYIDVTLDTIIEIFIALSMTSIFMGAFYFLFTKKDYLLTTKPTVSNKTGKEMSLVEIFILLGSINMLFVLFILVQITYLFGGQNNILTAEGLTYAEYARKGFFELIAVALISYLIIWKADSEVFKTYDNKPATYKVLTGMLVLFVQMIMFSAFRRLMLYEDAFGFTTLRLYSHFFTAWLGVVFVMLFYKIMVDNRNEAFLFRTAIVSLVFLFMLNFINPDRFIAQKNIDRYFATDKIDMEYLAGLSDDAAPEVLRLVKVKDKHIAAKAANKLLWELELVKKASKNNSWFAMPLPRSHAKRLLEERKAELIKALKNSDGRFIVPVDHYQFDEMGM